MAFFGLTTLPPALAKRAAQSDGDMLIPWTEWPVVRLWLAVQTQWRTSFGGLVGLDYPAVFAVMAHTGVTDPTGEIFDGLQTMESAALAALRKDK